MNHDLFLALFFTQSCKLFCFFIFLVQSPVINQVCYFTAFRYSPAVQVDLINYLWPTLLIILSSLLPKEKFCMAYLFSCAICMWGIYNLMPQGSDFIFSYESMFGLILALMAAVSWALYSLYTRYRKSSSANCISWASGLAAFFSILIHLCAETFVFPNLLEMTILLLLGVFQTGLALYFWESAIKKGNIKFLGLSSYAIPVFSILILVIFGKADFDNKLVTSTLAISLAPVIPLLKGKLSGMRKLKLASLAKRKEPILDLGKASIVKA